jgi:DNA-binding transcriptional MerR regulator
MKIQQVAEKTNLSIYTLRYYEQAGLVTPVERAANGHRDYSQDDVKRIVFVTRLRAAGMPIANIRRYVELAQQGDATVLERLQLLEEHKACIEERIEELRQHLTLINNKIEHYRDSHRDRFQGQENERTAPQAALASSLHAR